MLSVTVFYLLWRMQWKIGILSEVVALAESLILYGKEMAAARLCVSGTQVSKLTVGNGKSTLLPAQPGCQAGDFLIRTFSFTQF